ncbi:MAG TPA: 2'-5' RNA ligase family protein [Propylenella sp.]
MASGSDLDAVAAPLVLTVEMDGDAFAFFDDLRRRHYPAERNMIPAHVTLFHRLPGGRAREIKALLAKVAAGQKTVHVAVGDVKALERGVAIFLHSPQLHALRDALATEWWPWLTDQDKAGFRPHVTIQSNVGAARARATMQALSEGFRPRQIRAVGLHLWRYRGGAWESEQLFRFR